MSDTFLLVNYLCGYMFYFNLIPFTLLLVFFSSMQKHLGFIVLSSLFPLCNDLTCQLYCMQIVICYRMCESFILHMFRSLCTILKLSSYQMFSNFASALLHKSDILNNISHMKFCIFYACI